MQRAGGVGDRPSAEAADGDARDARLGRVRHRQLLARGLRDEPARAHEGGAVLRRKGEAQLRGVGDHVEHAAPRHVDADGAKPRHLQLRVERRRVAVPVGPERRDPAPRDERRRQHRVPVV